MIFQLTVQTGLIIAVIAFVVEYMDSTVGMGYGTTLTPLLIIAGFEPMQIIPAILLSELVTGLLAGFTHHSVGNVDFRPKTMNIRKIVHALKALGIFESFNRGIPRHLKIVIVVASCSIVGTAAAVMFTANIPVYYLRIYIGILIIMIGVVILSTLHKNYIFSWKRICFLGVVASFNKGVSGGGYGPVVMGGQLLAGIEGKNAVGITSLAEGLTCLAGVVGYQLVNKEVDWMLAPYLILGGILSAPLSALTVKKIKTTPLKVIIGFITVLLGCITFVKALMI